MRCNAVILLLAGSLLAGVSGALTAQQAPRRAFAEFTPGRCVIAPRIMDRVARRGVFDTVVYSPAADTLYTSTTDSLELCEAAFGGKSTDVRQDLNVARVQLLTGQDSLAIATARRHLKTFARRTPAERAWEHYLVFGDYMDGKPARLEQAREELAALDRLGKPAASLRVLAHYSMMRAAEARYDDSTTRAEAGAAIAAWKELPEELRLWRASALAYTYGGLAQLEALTHGGAAALVVLDTARATVPLAAKGPRGMIERLAKMYAVAGKEAAPIKADHWYNMGDAAASQPNFGQLSLLAGAVKQGRPSRGKVSLLLDVGRPCTNRCYALLKAMDRFQERFVGRSFEVTFLTQTFGYYVDTAPATPAAEAAYDSNYFVGELKLPGALAIVETKYSWKADGRRINAPGANQLNYPNTGLAIVDKKGIVRYVAGGWSPSLEERYAQYIEKLLAEP